MTTATLLVVNYHSADLTAAAIESARFAADRDLETVIVDNSVDPDEAARLQALSPDHLILSETNLGYGAGINRGLERCSTERVIVSNPDVMFTSGSIDLLLEQLEDSKVGVAGPAFYWDDDLTWHLPPAETMGFAEQFWRNLGSWLPPARRWRNRSRLSRRIRFWRAIDPIDVPSLSGAVMAFRATTLRSFRFDERYPLYFEEVDLIRRLDRAGMTARYIPSSRVRHVWAQSAVRNPRATELFALSRTRFQRRWYGPLSRALLRLPERSAGRECAGPEVQDGPLRLPSGGEFLVELGDGPDFLMATGRFVSGGEIVLPETSLLRSPLRELCCRVIDLSDGSIVMNRTVRI